MLVFINFSLKYFIAKTKSVIESLFLFLINILPFLDIISLFFVSIYFAVCFSGFHTLTNFV